MLLPCPANCSVDLHVTQMITGHRKCGPFLTHDGLLTVTIKKNKKTFNS